MTPRSIDFRPFHLCHDSGISVRTRRRDFRRRSGKGRNRRGELLIRREIAYIDTRKLSES